MPIIIIAAYAGRNQVVGKDGDLPWHFPSDLKFFKQTTIGHPVLMGSVTYQSILKRLKKPLPDRETIVITNDPSFRDERVKIIHSFKEIESYRNRAEPLFIIGGAKVYSQSMDIAQEMLITHIEQEVEGDAFFPEIKASQWLLKHEDVREENGTRLWFRKYSSVNNPARLKPMQKISSHTVHSQELHNNP